MIRFIFPGSILIILLLMLVIYFFLVRVRRARGFRASHGASIFLSTIIRLRNNATAR